jgi:hypothetical protein
MAVITRAQFPNLSNRSFLLLNRVGKVRSVRGRARLPKLTAKRSRRLRVRVGSDA